MPNLGESLPAIAQKPISVAISRSKSDDDQKMPSLSELVTEETAIASPLRDLPIRFFDSKRPIPSFSGSAIISLADALKKYGNSYYTRRQTTRPIAEKAFVPPPLRRGHTQPTMSPGSSSMFQSMKQDFTEALPSEEMTDAIPSLDITEDLWSLSDDERKEALVEALSAVKGFVE